MTISVLAIAAAAVWPALDASDAAIYRSIHEPRVVAVQPNHTHKEMVLMPDGKVEVRTNDTASTSLNFFRPVQPLEKSRRWIFAGAWLYETDRFDDFRYGLDQRRRQCAAAQDRGQVAVRSVLPASPDTCDRPRSEGRLLSLLPQCPSAIAQIGKGSQNQNFKIF